MKAEEKFNIKPLLLKVGVTFALSFAGFLFSRLKSGRKRQSLPPPTSLHPSGERACRKDEFHDKSTSSSSSGSIDPAANEKHEAEMYMPCVVGFSPNDKCGDKDDYLLPEFNVVVKEFDYSAATIGFSPRKDADSARSDQDIRTPKVVRKLEKDETQQEIRHLRSMVRKLRERESSLEVQLLEYYGLKEQETAVMELQNRLKVNHMEAKLFSLKIESLQADNRRLETQVSEYAKVMAELEGSIAKIKLLKKKLRSEAVENKQQISNLQQRVEKLQDQECKLTICDEGTQLNLTRLKELKDEKEKLGKSNGTLQLEISELSRKLEYTQILANSILEDPEAEAIKKASHRLRRENEALKKEIEQLQTDRCLDIEELVYLRWINACLRYEMRNYQPSTGKTVARDLGKSLSPKSEEKAKQLILEYANTQGTGDMGIRIMDIVSDQWSSSQASFFTDECDESSIDNLSTSKTNPSSKKFFSSKLRRLVKGKDTNHNKQRRSIDKTGSTEEGDSLRFSSSILGTSSSSSSRASSLDLSRIGKLKEEIIKDIDGVQRNNNVGSSCGYRKFGSGRESSADSALGDQHEQDSDSTGKSELLKYAEALRSSRERSTPILHSRSASYSSF